MPGGDCFAEHLVNRVGGGLVAAMMNSRYGWGAYVSGYVPGPSERIDTSFYYNVLVDDMFHIGEAHSVAKDAWVFYADSGAQYDMTRWCLYELNLLGDPEMDISLEMLDSDSDGISDDMDNCPFVVNSSQADSDFDGVGDLCDNCINHCNIQQGDVDIDGIGDVCDPEPGCGQQCMPPHCEVEC